MRNLLNGLVVFVLAVWPAVAAAAPPGAVPGATSAQPTPRPKPRAPLPPLPERVRQDSIRFAAGLTRASFDSLNAVFQRDIADARRLRDRGSLYRLLAFQGAGYAMTGDALRALPVLDEALPLIEADADTAWLMIVLRWRAYASGSLGRLDEQERAARRLVAVAEADSSARFLAIGHNFLGWIARQRGGLKQARWHLERAVEGHRALRNESEEAFARIAYGATLTDLGEYEAARRSYARQLEIARRLKQGWTEAQAYNDLGVLERRCGDPGKAPDYFRRAYEGMRSRGETPDLVGVLDNLAIAEMELGRAENARDLALQGIEICRRRGFTQMRGGLLVILAGAEELLGRTAASEAAWRRVVALGDSVSPDVRGLGVLGLSRTLQTEGRDAEALVVVEDAAKGLTTRLARADAAHFYTGWANRLWHVGRFADAIAMAERALAAEDPAAVSKSTVSAWSMIGTCRWKLGRMAGAAVAYDSACAAWERVRGRSAAPEWRASLWSSPGEVRFSAARFLLEWPASAPESVRIAAAYDRLQQFRSRTLLEQATRPRAGAAPPATPGAWSTSRVQRELLADGELLLEWAVGETSVQLFAITRTERRVFALGDPPALRAKIGTARELLGSAPRGDSDVAAAEAVARELARTVFGGAMPMVERARSLVLVPDGELHRVPFAALALRTGPLIDARSITTTPSIALLGQSRGRAHAAPRGLLAVAMGGGSGPRLAGAEREVAWLASSFERVERPATDVRDPAAFAATLAPHDALHFAGHTEYDDRFPWRSGIDIGAPEVKDAIDDPALPVSRGTRSGRSLLRAETIASTPLSARLVVLSSCETASGRIVAGEGLAGLSTAFLAGGAHTVVAALWSVDDRATETLMREFYRVLGTGRNASAALRMAQNRLRRDRQTRHPWYWAGFVLAGDGATTLDLRPTSPWRRMFKSNPLGHHGPDPVATPPAPPLAPTPPLGL